MKGVYIGIDGIDFSGKGTLSREFKKELTHGLHVREPTDECRTAILCHGGYDTVLAGKLMLADRHNQNTKVVQPYLNKGGTVVSDRTWISGTCYNGYGDAQKLTVPKGIIIPVIIKIDERTFNERRSKEVNQDDIESKPWDYHSNIQNEMITLAKENPNFMIINSMPPKEQVDLIMAHLATLN